MTSQGFLFGFARAQQANADAVRDADIRDARRNLDVAIHQHRVAAIRISRDQRRRVAAKNDTLGHDQRDPRDGMKKATRVGGLYIHRWFVVLHAVRGRHIGLVVDRVDCRSHSLDVAIPRVLHPSPIDDVGQTVRTMIPAHVCFQSVVLDHRRVYAMLFHRQQSETLARRLVIDVDPSPRQIFPGNDGQVEGRLGMRFRSEQACSLLTHAIRGRIGFASVIGNAEQVESPGHDAEQRGEELGEKVEYERSCEHGKGVPCV